MGFHIVYVTHCLLYTESLRYALSLGRLLLTLKQFCLLLSSLEIAQLGGELYSLCVFVLYLAFETWNQNLTKYYNPHILYLASTR